MRAHVLPDHIAVRCDLEHPAGEALRNECVAILKAPRSGDVRAEEGERRAVRVLPNNFVAPRVHLDDPRVRHWHGLPICAVIEDQYVAVGQHVRIVLLRQHFGTELPHDLAARLLDDHDRRDVAEARHDAPCAQWHDGVAVSPLGTAIVGSDHVLVRVEVLLSVPLPDAVAAGVDLHDDVGPHALGVRAGHTASHARGITVGHPLHGQVDRAAGRRTPAVVVVRGIAVLPDDIAGPVRLDQNAAPEVGPPHAVVAAGVGVRRARVLGALPVVEEVAVRQ